MRLPRFYTGRRINVFPMLLFCCQDSQGFGSLLFPFHLVADENTLFMRLKIDFLKFQQFYQLRGIYSTDFLVKLTKFHFECTVKYVHCKSFTPDFRQGHDLQIHFHVLNLIDPAITIVCRIIIINRQRSAV